MELYAEWKNTHDIKCGFSMFASLRSSNCLVAGASGTHSVCVCIEHQNFKLMIHCSGMKKILEELLATIVCNPENEDCMYGKCDVCPGTNHA